MTMKVHDDKHSPKTMKRLRTSTRNASKPIDLRKLRYAVRAFAQILEEDTSLYEMVEEEVDSCPSAFLDAEYAGSLPDLKRLVNQLENELTDRIEVEDATRQMTKRKL